MQHLFFLVAAALLLLSAGLGSGTALPFAGQAADGSQSLGNQHKHHNKSFVYFILSREWPFTFCSVDKCKHKDLLPKDFTIHGLWPQGEDGERPMFCEAKFNESQLAPLNETLLRDWIDCKNPSDYPVDFWKEEYKKHGSCAALDPDYNSTLKYFAAAVNVSETWPIMPMLRKQNIVPGNQSYKVSDISSAVKQEFGFAPSVRCVKNPDKNSDNSELLIEIRLCVSKQLQPMQCEDSLRAASSRQPMKRQASDLSDNLIFSQPGSSLQEKWRVLQNHILYPKMPNGETQVSVKAMEQETFFKRIHQLLQQQQQQQQQQMLRDTFECDENGTVMLPPQPVEE